MADQIGVSFIPSQDNQQAPGGPPQGQLSGDLASAYKILSLRLPSIVGSGGIAPNALLQSQGALGVPGAKSQPGGFNPYAALFEVLLKHGLGQPTGQPVSSTMPIPGGAPQRMPMTPPPAPNYNMPAPPQAMPPPPRMNPVPTRIIPGGEDTQAMPAAPNPSPTFGSWTGNEQRRRFTGY
jgi:hypothetical protein